MKHIPYLTITAVVFGISMMTSSLLRADDEKTTSTTTTTTVTADGTVNQYSPDAIVVSSPSSTTPIRYSATKTTTFVDENGNPVAMETVKSGLPVTVYYDREGNNLVATKVVVKRVAVVDPNAPAPVIQKSTTTTTTTKKDDD